MPDQIKTADPNSADPNSADPNSADPNSADPNSADPNSADPNSADPNSADPNSADAANAVDVDTAPKEHGYRAPQVCKLVGITYRQLDYWARTDLLRPSLRGASGSGSQRLYSFTDVVQLKVVKRLLDAGMSLKKIREAVDNLRAELESDRPLMDVTLLSDGNTIFAARSATELEDVFRKGQGVFGIAVGPVQLELEGEIHELFPDGGEQVDGLVQEASAN